MKIPILSANIPLTDYFPIDLGEKNEKLRGYALENPEQCQRYIDSVMAPLAGKVAYGGYLEKRLLYSQNSHFNKSGESRNIHLGIDFWAPAGTEVLVPYPGKIHSFADNLGYGNYGPTIILEHWAHNATIYTLYGHLTRKSLNGLEPGKFLDVGASLAFLGLPTENGGYAPHLHFQVINNLNGWMGDYPGVCTESDLDFYKKNCPDPEIWYSQLSVSNK